LISFIDSKIQNKKFNQKVLRNKKEFNFELLIIFFENIILKWASHKISDYKQN
jgi:hypothetical protein